MRMKLYDRILLGLYALLGVAAAAVLALVGVNAYRNDGFAIGAMGIQLPGGVATLLIMLGIALVLLVWSVKMLLLAFKHEPRIDKTSVSVQNTENGSVRITVAAMDTLIKQAIGNREGIVDVKSKIINHEDSISVQIEMALASDVHIPNVTMLLQRTVKNFIEEFSGIAVREVTVLVTSIVEIVPPHLAIEANTGKPPIDGEVIERDDEMMPEEPDAENAPIYDDNEPAFEADEPIEYAPADDAPQAPEEVDEPAEPSDPAGQDHSETAREYAEEEQLGGERQPAQAATDESETARDTEGADHPEKEIW